MDQQGIDDVSVCALRPITLCLFLSVSQMNTLIWSLPPFISVCLCSLCSSLGRLCWWLPLFRLSEPITRRIITPSLAELTLTIFNWSSQPPPLTFSSFYHLWLKLHFSRQGWLSTRRLKTFLQKFISDDNPYKGRHYKCRKTQSCFYKQAVWKLHSHSLFTAEDALQRNRLYLPLLLTTESRRLNIFVRRH